MRRAYQTNLSDAEWSYIEPHLPTPKAPGRPRVHPLREILDAIFYILRSGCMVDSQSVKSTGVGGEGRGYDGGKKVKGRKRHLLVDRQELLLKALGSIARK